MIFRCIGQHQSNHDNGGPHLYISDRLYINFFESSSNEITCTITSVVYANYVDSKVLLSVVTIIQCLEIRNFAEEHHSYVIKTVS